MIVLLLKAGIHAGLSPIEERKVRLLNVMATVGWACFLFLLVFNLLQDSPLVFLITNIAGQSILLLTILLNHFRYYKLARWFCMLFLWAFFTGVSFLLGKESGIEYLQLILCVSPLVFFDELRDILMMSSLSLIGFLISKIGYHSFPPVLQNPNLPVIHTINMVILFICSFLLLFFYRSQILRYSGIVERQNRELAEKNKEITDSVSYARRIQNALLRFDRSVQETFPESFIHFRPRDLVGGDFFWFHQEGNKVWAACVDCTGHGIPGAFMTMIGITLLNDIVIEKKIHAPAKVLDELNAGVTRMFRQREDDQRLMRDGMELVLVCLNTQTREMEYACANSSFLVVRNGEAIELKGDTQPIGWHIGETVPFTAKQIALKEGDGLYLFTDGITDQFGGPGGKKFLYSRLRKLLMEMHPLPIEQQKEKILAAHSYWQGDLDQVDDITLIGAIIP